ncbi:hypothetical protein KY312_01385 [Candidatus Woesearchaeota archaeon]|nr:hypothetical protein [Candidatus Woesearchaeota archaeon]
MEDNLKKYLNEIHDIVHSAGKDLMSSLNSLKKLKDKKEVTPKEISDIIAELEEHIPETFRKHFLINIVLQNSGAIEKPEYPIDKPILKSCGDIEDYDRNKISDSIHRCGIDKGVADEMSQLATKELEKKYDLGKRVIHTRYISHVVYQILLNTGKVHEAANYKNYAGKTLDKHEENQMPLYERIRRDRGHLSVRKILEGFKSRMP